MPGFQEWWRRASPATPEARRDTTPIRVGTGVRARGLTPNVHITCVNQDRVEILKALETCHSLGIENIFAITGDYPLGADASAPPLFAMDSVQLVEMISELRAAGMPFYTSVAVSPFKYTEADCAYQYLKLEKKIAAGADYAITQLGYDSRKFRELKRYLDERGLKTPVFGNVYVLPAESRGEVLQRRASRLLGFERTSGAGSGRSESRRQRHGRAPGEGGAHGSDSARPGLCGSVSGRHHNAERIQWIIQRSEEVASQWEEFAEEISYGPKGGFYLLRSNSLTPRSRWGTSEGLGRDGAALPCQT